jgi:hypothetical protein
MPANRKVRILTAALLVAVAGIGVAPQIRKSRLLQRPHPPGAPEPQDTIYAMLNAARAGDVKAYLAAYTDSMEAALRQTVAESSEPAFAQYLRSSAASIKGVATSDPEKISGAEAKVRVEYIYQERNEAQTMYLEKRPNGWKIARADAGERVPTLIPYGTPVK